MSAEQDKSIVRRLVLEAQQGGALELVDNLLADEFVDHTPLPGLPPTRDGVKMLFGAMKEAFPDLTVTIMDQVAEGGRVATRKWFQGTQRGPFLGVPPSGRRISVEVIDILRIQDGKITDHWVALDNMELMKQLGAM